MIVDFSSLINKAKGEEKKGKIARKRNAGCFGGKGGI
jgi:hypothetical protein